MKYEGNILIVDDQLSAREVLRVVLEDKGYLSLGLCQQRQGSLKPGHQTDPGPGATGRDDARYGRL